MYTDLSYVLGDLDVLYQSMGVYTELRYVLGDLDVLYQFTSRSDNNKHGAQMNKTKLPPAPG